MSFSPIKFTGLSLISIPKVNFSGNFKLNATYFFKNKYILKLIIIFIYKNT